MRRALERIVVTWTSSMSACSPPSLAIAPRVPELLRARLPSAPAADSLVASVPCRGQSSGNQVAQSSGNRVAIEWQSSGSQRHSVVILSQSAVAKRISVVILSQSAVAKRILSQSR